MSEYEFYDIAKRARASARLSTASIDAIDAMFEADEEFSLWAARGKSGLGGVVDLEGALFAFFDVDDKATAAWTSFDENPNEATEAAFRDAIIACRDARLHRIPGNT